MCTDIKTALMTSKLGLESKVNSLIHQFSSTHQNKVFDFQLGGNYSDKQKALNSRTKSIMRTMNTGDRYSGILHRVCPFKPSTTKDITYYRLPFYNITKVNLSINLFRKTFRKEK